ARAGERLAGDLLRQPGYSPGQLAHDNTAPLRQGQAGRVVAAVLQPAESLEQQGRCVPPTGVPDDTAHQTSSRAGSSSGGAAASSPTRPSWESLPSSRSVTSSAGSTVPQRAQMRSLRRDAPHTAAG